MIRPPPPKWFAKAREFAARIPSPVGAPFAAKKSEKVAKLYVYDAIGKDPWSGAGIDPLDVVKALDEASGAESLEVHINSPGGFVFDGISIFNAIRGFNGEKTVYVDGIAASIASIIALAGDRVVTNEGGTWMIHNPMGGIFSFGTADEIEDDARKTVQALRKIRETLLEIYTNATGQSVAKLSAWMEDETWMTADEARERGFTDEIVKQPPPEEEPGEAAARLVAREPRTTTPAELIARARADYADLQKRFGGASPSVKPGEPGPKNAGQPGNARQKDSK